MMTWLAPQEEGVAEMELHHALRGALDALSDFRPKLATAPSLRYGLPPFCREHTDEEIARVFRCSQKRARYYVSVAMMTILRHRGPHLRMADAVGVTGFRFLNRERAHMKYRK